MEIVGVFKIVFVEESCFLYFFVDFWLDQVEKLILFIKLILHGISSKEPVKDDILFDVGFLSIIVSELLFLINIWLDNLSIGVDLVFLLVNDLGWIVNRLF